MKKLIIIATFIVTLVMQSCYKDLGNYEYNENVNDVNVVVPKIIDIVKKDIG